MTTFVPSLTHVDVQYANLLRLIKAKGRVKNKVRTAVGRLSVSGPQMQFDLSEGFPLTTGGKNNFDKIKAELLGFIAGYTNNNDFLKLGCDFWTPWANTRLTYGGVMRRADELEIDYGVVDIDEDAAEIFSSLSDAETETFLAMTREELFAMKITHPDRAPLLDVLISELDVVTNTIETKGVGIGGELGPIYGAQWRNWNGEGYDQLGTAIQTLRTNPEDSRIIISAWNPLELPDSKLTHEQNIHNGKQVLPPCHTMFQLIAEPLTQEEIDDISVNKIEVLGKIPEYRLTLKMYQRSCDVPVGWRANVASYALLTHMVAQVVGMVPGDFIHTLGDAHIYLDQMDAVDQYLAAEVFPMPELWLNPAIKEIDDFTMDDIKLIGYQHGKFIKTPVAI